MRGDQAFFGKDPTRRSPLAGDVTSQDAFHAPSRRPLAGSDGV